MDLLNINDPIANFLGDWSKQLNFYSIVLRVVLAVLLAAITGCERSGKRHAAGLRTFILVSLASTVSIIIDIALCENYGSKLFLLSAASVIAMAIISSNSILFSSRNQIKGLTTSAGLWACGILGFSVGAGYYTLSIICFITLLCSLSFFPAIEKYLKDRSNHFEIYLELKDIKSLQNFVIIIRELGLSIDDIEANPAYNNSGLSVYSVSVSIVSKELKKYKTHSDIIAALGTLEYVNHIEEMR